MRAFIWASVARYHAHPTDIKLQRPKTMSEPVVFEVFTDYV